MPRRIAGPRALADHLRKPSELTPEDQSQNKPDSERSKDRLRWIFAHVLLRVFLECAGAIPRIPPCLFCLAASFTPGLPCLAAIFFSDGPCCRSQIFSCSASMLFTALQLVAGVPRGVRLLFCFVLFCHWLSPVDFRCNYPRALQIGQTNLARAVTATLNRYNRIALVTFATFQRFNATKSLFAKNDTRFCQIVW